MRGKLNRLPGLAPLLAFLALLTQAQGQNVIVNPSFETWLDTIGVNMPLGWLTSATTDSTSAVRTTDSHSGTYAIKLVTGDTAGYMATTTIVSPGAVYNFSAWARTGTLVGGSFVITWLKFPATPVGSPILVPVTRTSDYHQFTQRVTAPDSAYLCVVAFATTPMIPGITVYVDDVTLEAVPSGVRAGPQPVSLRFQMYPAQPNPFPVATTISYAFSVGAVARLKIYDLVGNEVRTLVDDYKPAGLYAASWNATDDDGESVSPGIYFCRLEVGDQTLTQKLMLLGE